MNDIINNIKGITPDSRRVRTGFLFAALRGSRQDGHAYIADAVRNGATHILVARGAVLPLEAQHATIIESDSPEHDFSLMAARFYGAQPGTIVAVTGTNGKTSTAHFVQQIWAMRGKKAASLGTLGVRGTGVVKSGSMTTPDAVALHEGLADLAAAGITHLAMEASSHGLKQHRLDGVVLRAAGFTNLTRDHLDYHPDMADYFAAKARLFADILPAGGVAVLNADVPEYAALSDLCARRGVKILSYGIGGGDLRLIDRAPRPGGQTVSLSVMGQAYTLTVPLVGAFMVMNALCALGLVLAAEEEDEQNIADIVACLERLEGAPGRLQLVPGHPRGAAVYVDYAHTPDALENILHALRPHTKKNLVCLFGCGGDRDPGKRAMMGEISTRLADKTIITDDNPRSEDPAHIRAQIMAAAPGAVEIGNRRTAIHQAIADLQPGDVLVLAGKGHEQGQIFATHTDPFDDVAEAASAIQKLTDDNESKTA